MRGIKGVLTLQGTHRSLSLKVSSSVHFKLLCFPNGAVKFRTFFFFSSRVLLSDGCEFFLEDSICKCPVASVSSVAISIDAQPISE